MVRTYSDADRREVVRLYIDEDLSGVEIATRTGIGSTTVYTMLAQAGVDTSRGRRKQALAIRKFSDAEEEEIARRYAGGDSTLELAAQYGVTDRTIASAVRRQKGVIRKFGEDRRRERRVEIRDQILTLRDEGLSQVVIGARVGVSQTAVSRVLCMNGRSTGHSRDRHHNWKGGRHVAQGYVLVRVYDDDPMVGMRNSMGYALEHRIIMARALGRPLDRSETVHHINGDKADNRLENLQLRQGNHGKGVAARCADCGSHNVIAGEID